MGINDIIKYYSEEYDEDKRLGESCDNRHKVEVGVKRLIYSNYISKGMKVLDVCGGTGIWSKYMRDELGCSVKACDIVPSHVEHMRDNNIDAFISDARDLSNIDDNSYDIVLLNGAIYHLSGKDKEVAIAESKRVLKDGGLLFIDYLSQYHGFIQQCLRYDKFLSECNDVDIKLMNCKDKMFKYDTEESMRELVGRLGLDVVEVLGVDGISRYIRDEINKWDSERLAGWVELQYINRNRCIDLSEHSMVICKKDE